MSCGKVKNPPGFALCRVAKSKTRRVSRYVEWRNPKPAGFRAMSCGKVQNPPGFAPCRVTKSKTRQVLRHVECGNMKPAKFCTYPCRGAKAYAPKMSCDRGLRLKPAKFCTYPCRGVLHTPQNNPHRRFGSKIGCVFGCILIGEGEIGCVFGVFVCGNVKPVKFCMYPCRGVLHTPPNVLRRRFGV